MKPGRQLALVTEGERAMMTKESDFDGSSRSSSEDGRSNSGKTRPSSRWLSTMAGVAYGVVALVMGFVNKACLQSWPYSNTLLTFQMAASIAIIYASKVLGASVHPFDWKAARNLLPVVFFYNANVAFALAGLQALDIPIFNALKRLTPVMVLVAKYFIGDASPSRQVVCAVMTVVTGCIIAGIGDLTFDPFGYSMALMSCLLQTTYLVLVERSGSEKGFNSTEILLYNAALSLPVLLTLIHITGEVYVSVPAIIATTRTSPNFIFLLVFSLFMGVLLNYTLFLCTLCNSALTTTVVGALKGVISSVLGFFLLGGMEPTFLVVLGITMNTLGGIWYTAVKYHQRGIRRSNVEEPLMDEPPNGYDETRNGYADKGTAISRPLIGSSSSAGFGV